MSTFYAYTTLRVLLVVMSMLYTSHACFPVHDQFKDSRVWMQPISVPDRHLWSFGDSNDEDGKTLLVRTERDELVENCTCLKSVGGDHYMANITVASGSSHFQCLKFTALTERIVRIARSPIQHRMENLNCEDDDVYVEEAAVLISYIDIPTVPCPLQGGFQMLIQQSADDVCAENGWQENPSIQFECYENNNVVVQFGHYCVPKVLKDAQKMRGRYLTHLNCVGSWDEPGKGKFALLQMRDMFQTFWCMNYNVSDDGEIYDVYLTFDGRCTVRNLGKLDDASRHGHLVKYLTPTDERCAQENTKICVDFDFQLCSSRNDCPNQCNRCLPMKMEPKCQFPRDMAGQWNATTPSQNLVLNIGHNAFTMSDKGRFECVNEEKSLAGSVFSVVQQGLHSSCMPFYACSKIRIPTPSLINFYVRPAATVDGKISTCAKTNTLFGHVIPIREEKELTMLNLNKLKIIPCGVPQRRTFPTNRRDKCEFAVEECSGNCTTLEVGLDSETCSRTNEIKLETNHSCLAVFNFDLQNKGIVARSIQTGRIRCWIFIQNKELRLAPLDECNTASVNLLIKYYFEEYRHDPIYALEYNEFTRSETSYASCLLPKLQWILLQALLVCCLGYSR